MATTSLKLPDELKARVAKIAEATGKTPHAFMVDAISAYTHRSEEEAEFLARAKASFQHYQETGISYAAEDVHAYVRAKLRGENPPELVAVKDKK